MNWVEVFRSIGGSVFGKVIFWGWNDFNGCSRESYGEVWFVDLWIWVVILKC